MGIAVAMAVSATFAVAALAIVRGGRGGSPCDDCPVLHGSCGNPRSRWLGKEVVVRSGRDEERCVVICESWKGAVRVRPLDGRPAYWVHKEHVAERVREA